MNQTWFPEYPPVDHYEYQIEISGDDEFWLTLNVLSLKTYLYAHKDNLKGKWGYRWREKSMIFSTEYPEDLTLIKLLFGEV